MWRCDNCQTKYDTPGTYTEAHGEERDCCPICGGGERTELYACNICGDHYPYEEMSDEDVDVCGECAGNTFAKWDKVKTAALNANFTPAQITFLKWSELA